MQENILRRVIARTVMCRACHDKRQATLWCRHQRQQSARKLAAPNPEGRVRATSNAHWQLRAAEKRSNGPARLIAPDNNGVGGWPLCNSAQRHSSLPRSPSLITDTKVSDVKANWFAMKTARWRLRRASVSSAARPATTTNGAAATLPAGPCSNAPRPPYD